MRANGLFELGKARWGGKIRTYKLINTSPVKVLPANYALLIIGFIVVLNGVVVVDSVFASSLFC